MLKAISTKLLMVLVMQALTLIFAHSVVAGAARNVGELVIDRAWEEKLGDYRCAYALVTWKNSTSKVYRAVTIQAIAYDSSENMLNVGKRSFFSHEVGPIGPGFKQTLKIPVELKNGDFKSMRASVISAVT